MKPQFVKRNPHAQNVTQFPRIPIRAIHIVPDDSPRRDICKAVIGGLPTKEKWPPREIYLRGTLRTVLREMRTRDIGLGLPIIVHPECHRRHEVAA